MNFLPGMQHGIDVSFMSFKDWDVADYSKISSRRCNWYANETDRFQVSFNYLFLRKRHSKIRDMPSTYQLIPK